MKINPRPHRMPAVLVGPDAPEDILAWKCVRCHQWIKEFGPFDATECPGCEAGIEIEL